MMCLTVTVPAPAFTGHWRSRVLQRSKDLLKYGTTPYLTNTLMLPLVTYSSGGERMNHIREGEEVGGSTKVTIKMADQACSNE